MRSAKDRKHIKERKRKALGAARTDASRARRLDNKAKRAEIISINSHAKIDIIDQETYVDGVKVEVTDNRIVPVVLEPEVVVAADEGEVNVMKSNGKINKTLDDQVEKVRLGIFNNLADRFKKK